MPLDAASGSAEPHLASGPDGTVILSFLEPDGDGARLRYSVLQSHAWSAPQTVATGADWLVNWADYPSVEPIGARLWAAHWLVRSAGGPYAYDAFAAQSNDLGQSWTEPVRLHADAQPAEHGFVSLFGTREGTAAAVWLDGGAVATDPDGGTMQLRSAELPVAGNARSETVLDARVCDCCQTDTAITRSGPVVVYRDRSPDEIRDISITRLIDGVWEAPRPVSHDGWKITGCPVNGPAVAANDTRVAVAWFTAVPVNRVQVAFSDDSGATFADAIDLGARDPLGRVDVALLPNGDAAVSWLERSQPGTLTVQRVAPSGPAGQAVAVAPMQTTRNAGFPQMVAVGDRLIFAWTDVSDGASRVRSAVLQW